MNEAAGGLLQQLILASRLAKITPEVIRQALEGFAFRPQKEFAWLVRGIRAALYVSRAGPGYSPPTVSNSEVREELLKLSKQASDCWQALWTRSSSADSAIFDFAFRAESNWGEEGGASQPPELARFSEAVRDLEWLADFLRSVGDSKKPQQPKWRQKDAFEQRVFRGQCLAVIYEEAFGKPATVVTGARTTALGHWADFYQRMVAMAFDERATPNLEGVLDEARRRHKEHRVIFGPELLPE